MKLLHSICLFLLFLIAGTAAHAQPTNINVRATIGSGKNAIGLTTASSPANRSFKMSQVKDIIYATEWSEPEIDLKNKLVTPARPEGWENLKCGWVLEVKVAPASGGLIRLIGTATYTEVKTIPGLYGEHSGPILSPNDKRITLSNNVANTAATLTSTTPFQLDAVPGKDYTINVLKLNKAVPLKIVTYFPK